MKKDKIIKYSILITYLAIQLFLYIAFFIDDFKPIGINNILFKYLTIIMANVLTLASLIVLLFKRDGRPILDNKLNAIALIFTLISDYFLLVKGEHLEIGLLTFICVQVTYFIRLILVTKCFDKKRIQTSIIIRVGMFVLLADITFFASMFEPLYLLVAFYFPNLIMNFVDSLISYRKAKKINDTYQAKFLLILSIGFLLFIGCDISVGLANLIGKCGVLIWLFYTPSQILISLTAINLIDYTITPNILRGV